MQVPVELFGIARARAGIAATTASGNCVGDVLQDLASRFPGLAETCIDGRKVRSGYTLNLNGERFISAPETLLKENDVLLLLSMDAGG